MNGLEAILWKLRQDKKYTGTNDTYTLFSQFYKTDGNVIKKWVNGSFQKGGATKSNNHSDQFRKQGNGFYVKGKWSESLEHYTKALCFAEYQTESYAMALANRSAVFYSLNEYQYCLSDINRCLDNYPNRLKYKVYSRKIKCYCKIGDVDEARISFKEAVDFIKGNQGFTKEEKDCFIEKLQVIDTVLPDSLVITTKEECKIPDIEKNNMLIGASTLIGLRSNTKKGRYVVAERSIRRGDIIFVEKAFAISPIFNKNLELCSNKCYYCLKNNQALIPCLHCCSCMYCDENCLERSWNESHQWECKGFGVKFWSDVGLAFPAFKTYLKSLAINDDIENTSVNYKLVDELLMNLENNENIVEFLVLTVALVHYFETQTDFFDWLRDKVDLESDQNLKLFFGSCVLRKIGQFACNASVIEHWDVEKYKYVPQEKVSIATGLYPAVSMMNHSCKSNVSMYYINDVVVVKAIEDIAKGEELYNCYHVSYRSATKEIRQSFLYTQYCFRCLCNICSNPVMELDYLNTFRCPWCAGGVSMYSKGCYDCQKFVDLSKVVELEKQAIRLLDEAVLSLDKTEISFKIMKRIYNQYHKNFADCYNRYKLIYFHTGNLDKSLEYFSKYLEVQKKHFGEHSLTLVKETLGFLEELKMQGKGNRNRLYVQNPTFKTNPMK
ncbi:hypothetical protein Trydic_g5809 [Trypoxylus dichotomus]